MDEDKEVKVNDTAVAASNSGIENNMVFNILLLHISLII